MALGALEMAVAVAMHFGGPTAGARFTTESIRASVSAGSDNRLHVL
jgi:hypothetical protein